MGIIRTAIKTVTGTVKSAVQDQFLEAIEPENMGETTVFTSGRAVRKGANRGSVNTVSDGSVIHVYDNQFMILTDGGKVIDYTAEPGYYTVSNSSLPSMFNGQFDEALQESFSRLKFGGTTPVAQKVFYINLQEIKGLKFGTRNAVNYFDNFYNAELFLRAHGTYSVKITDPLKFYAEVVPRNAQRLEIEEINAQYLSEFLEALQTAINQLSAEGMRISYVSSQAAKLGRYMANVLDESWNQTRGMEIQSVGIASISYDEESQKLINMRNQGAMMGDPSIREGYVQSSIAQGLQAAGSNANGAGTGFVGMGMGMGAAGGFLNQASQTNWQQMQANQAAAAQANQAAGMPATTDPSTAVQPQASGGDSQQSAGGTDWTCGFGQVNSGNFCSNCGKPKPSADWTCSCGTLNHGNFCTNCGKARG